MSPRTLQLANRAQRRNAGHIHPLLALRHGAAQNNVFNLFGIKLRHAIERAFDRNGSQFIGTSSPQLPLYARPTGVRTEETMTTSRMG